MKIKICSQSVLEKMSGSGFEPRTAVISITDVEEKEVGFYKEPEFLLRLCFDDINSPFDMYGDSRKLALNLFSREQADQIAEFVFHCKDHIDTLICQCRWGYSRSSAVATAVKEYFFHEGMEIFSDEEYYPNLYVFRECLKALKRTACYESGRMKVSVYSRRTVEKLIQEGFPEKTAVISFFDPKTSRHIPEDYRPVDYQGKTDRLISVPLHDIDLSVLPDFGLTYDTYFPEADHVAKFIYSAKEDGYDIICQCEYGESRSSGCAAAILEHFYGTGISIFADYRYYPNQVVYHKVLDALEAYSGKSQEKR